MSLSLSSCHCHCHHQEWHCHHQQSSSLSSVIFTIATAASAVSLATACHPQNPEVDAKGVTGSDGKKYVDGSFHEEPSEPLIVDLCH